MSPFRLIAERLWSPARDSGPALPQPSASSAGELYLDDRNMLCEEPDLVILRKLCS
jgi:hypothetical protein